MLDEIPNEKNQFFWWVSCLKRIWEKDTPFIEVFVPNFCNFIHFLFRFFPLILQVAEFFKRHPCWHSWICGLHGVAVPVWTPSQIWSPPLGVHLKIDRYTVLSLGDVGFLLFFRVVSSGDYGKPCSHLHLLLLDYVGSVQHEAFLNARKGDKMHIMKVRDRNQWLSYMLHCQRAELNVSIMKSHRTSRIWEEIRNHEVEHPDSLQSSMPIPVTMSL